MKTKKWSVKVIFHFTDLALVNSWLNYKEDTKEAGCTKSQVLHLLDFRMQVAEALIRGSQDRKRRGRPSADASGHYEHHHRALPSEFPDQQFVGTKKVIGRIRK